MNTEAISERFFGRYEAQPAPVGDMYCYGAATTYTAR